ncbi:LysR substrate-binding domain-containing protein [Leucobacter sp. GX24907]
MSTAPDPLRLGFARGIAPSKWQRRWRAAVPERPLELVPVDTAFGRRDESLETPIDMMLERCAPGQVPEGAGEATTLTASGSPTRRALRLYTEAIALVVPKDHELVETSGRNDPALDRADLDLVTILEHPDHASAWPAAVPWSDPSYRPKNLAAALQLVAAGLGTILMPLPLARHLISKREHAIVTLMGDQLPGSTVWATWATERDAADVQQLAGVLRGRTARSSRTNGGGDTDERSASKSPRSESAAAKHRPKQAAKPKLKPNSRGAQLQAAREKAERKKTEKRQEKRRKRR